MYVQRESSTFMSTLVGATRPAPAARRGRGAPGPRRGARSPESGVVVFRRLRACVTAREYGRAPLIERRCAVDPPPALPRVPRPRPVPVRPCVHSVPGVRVVGRSVIRGSPCITACSLSWSRTRSRASRLLTKCAFTSNSCERERFCVVSCVHRPLSPPMC